MNAGGNAVPDPSCSNYGLIAIEKSGFFKGWVKTIGRIMHCVGTRVHALIILKYINNDWISPNILKIQFISLNFEII